MTDSIYSTTRAAGPSTALHTTRTGRSQADTTHESILPDQPKGGFKDLFGEVGEDVVDQMSQNFSDSPQDEDTSIGHKVFDYLERSGEQFVMGNYTDEVTLLGTAMQIGSGLVGLDLPGDIRDLTYDLTNWEWSWGHAGQTLLDAAGVLPVVGSLKYLDEAGAVVKGGVKNLDEAAGLANKVQDAAQDGIKNISANAVKNESIVSQTVKSEAANSIDNIAAPGPANFMTDSDRFYINASKRTDIDPDGYFDVVAHGTPNKIQIETQNGPVLVDHRSAARLIQQQSGYNGQKVRLLSCSTGANNMGFAQNLANKLNVEVQAPTDLLWAYPNGKTLVAPKATNGQPDLNKLGEIKIFLPKRIR
jgi:hypothetical protein